MAKRKGQLPSGNVRKQVFVGYEYLFDENGEPILDENGIQKKRRKYKSITAASSKEVKTLIHAEKEKKRHVTCSDTLKTVMDRYLIDMKDILSPSTLKAYKSYKKNFNELENIKVKDLTTETVQDWINDFSSKRSAKTVKNHYGFLLAVTKKYNVEISAVLPKVEIKKTFIPSDDDVKQIVEYFKAINDTDMVIAIYLGATGPLRRSEICGLTSDDIDGNVLHIHKSIVYDMNNKTVEKNTVKNYSSDRFLSFPDYIMELLPKEGHLVNLKPDHITKRFFAGQKKCGIRHFRFHDLRHYAASVLHAIGVPDLYIMKRGGWSTDSTMKRVYRNSLEDYEKAFEDKTISHFNKLN